MAPTIQFITTEEGLRRCAEVMRELRPHLMPERIVEMALVQLSEGYKLVSLEEDGQVLALAGFRLYHMLVAGGKTLYVDDLVTASERRSGALGAELLRWVAAYARSEGCVRLTLDSGLDNYRAHKFYLRENLRISAFHFAKSVIDPIQAGSGP